MAHGDDIKWRNEHMPYFPKQMPLWQRVMCLLGYHKMEVRVSPRRFNSYTGAMMDASRARDQCGRCGMLTNDRQIPDPLNGSWNDTAERPSHDA